jgi:hypothetical protein
MMEEHGVLIMQEGINFLKEAKYVGLDVDILDAMLPMAENISTAKQQQQESDNEIGNTDIPIQRPSPPTPPIEEDLTPIKDALFMAPCVNEASAPPPAPERKEGKRRLALLRQLGIGECSIPCLQSVKDLRGKYEPRYKLNLNVKKNTNRTRYLSAYKRKWNLLIKLEEWENVLNECSPDEPYISVENKVDNYGPPVGFVYIAKSIMPSNVDYLFDKDYLVGCSCERCTPLTCDCPKNSGGSFAYDRIGRVQFEPGKPIYECNSRCSCSVSCRNRVVQRGRTVRVSYPL